MAIYIDPPFWPAHETLWSHLVSDTSYAELHQFAARLGLPRRSFDLDHYDVPASVYDRAVIAGALAVGSRDVVHRLRDSGLRVKHLAREAFRPEARATYLRDEWAQLLRVIENDAPPRTAESWQRLGAELTARWHEPHRKYHDARHLEDVLLSLDHLRTRGEAIDPVSLLAAWFHDAIYTGRGDQDEVDSARLAAAASLSEIGLSASLVHQVGEIVIATAPGIALPKVPVHVAHLLDADLAIFAASPQRYSEYSASVRAEYSHIENAEFRLGRAQILRSYLERPAVYRSSPAQALWEAQARTNLNAEIQVLEAGSGAGSPRS